MRATDIRSCYIGPIISPEQFVPEHFFLFIAKGRIHGYDGKEMQTLNEGEYALVIKNHLARYNKERVNDAFEKIVVVFDEAFLKQYQKKYEPVVSESSAANAFVKLDASSVVPKFIQSLLPYYNGFGRIDEKFADTKREELLAILLRNQPELSGTLFRYAAPEKLNLEAFMNSNYKFNVSIQRFAYLTGRSLSAFKRDFKTTFNSTPNRWLIQRRLQEAYFLINKQKKKPSDIYLDLGFEDLSHFSHAFKKHFGTTPTEVATLQQER